ncbi:hypothetical protein NECAME_09101 [Necator americanus]|uniref:Channel protein, hemolysin III family n=1 Tax=Necator americanus TaxID=51031 RepID=W2TFA2_NECAM|nr:hypothetical protein NECAME_09101 [Necator americanus]ETN80518.1 hypothetical protein NECAME_09101 [Necator americanus]
MERDISEALSQVLHDSGYEFVGDRIVEDSTTVQVKNPAARKTGEEIEVLYTRTTQVLSQPNSDDENLEAFSDSEVTSRCRTSSVGRGAYGSDDEGRKHTVLRYRRRRGGQWRQVQRTDISARKGDEDELEVTQPSFLSLIFVIFPVDVTEECSETTGIVTKTYEARWKVLKYEHLPEWLQDNEFLRLDYMGISLLIIGSFIPWIYYGFYCRMEPKITYIAMVSVLGGGAIVVSLWDKFSESRFRPWRAGVFVAMGLSGIVPTVHYIITDGVRSLFEDNAFHWLLLMAFLYLLGALLYATRTPERFFPGKCDIWFQSHQLFHTCVVIAAFVHYFGISEMAWMRLNDQCPSDRIFNQHDEL